jgi:hypothetical protein
VHPNVLSWDELRGFGLRTAWAADLPKVWRLARDLIGRDIVDPARLAGVWGTAPASVQVFEHKGRIEGTLAVLPLSRFGVQAITGGVFDARKPDAAHLATTEWELHGVYTWGAAAATPSAARAVMRATAFLCQRRYPHLPAFGRAATPQGDHALRTKLGFVDFGHGPSGLLWRPTELRAAA